MKFNIEEYLNNLPDTTTEINVSSRNLTYLPDLSRFYKLEILSCSYNQLTELPPLNPSLTKLFCSGNRLTRLPPINPNLNTLYCFSNYLTYLPLLNDKLEMLFCTGNKLKSMPLLNDKLEILYFANNPIYDVVAFKITNIVHIKKNVQTLHKFKYLFYLLKFKNKFRDWLWVKVREPKIKEYYSPANLLKLLSGIDEDDYDQFDNVVSNW